MNMKQFTLYNTGNKAFKNFRKMHRYYGYYKEMNNKTYSEKYLGVFLNTNDNHY